MMGCGYIHYLTCLMEASRYPDEKGIFRKSLEVYRNRGMETWFFHDKIW